MKALVRFFNSAGDNGLVLNAAILIGYFILLRQRISDSQMDPPHTLRAKDITTMKANFNTRIRSSKTLLSSAAPHNIAVSAISGSVYCPADAWNKYVSRTQSHRDGPAFITIDAIPLKPHDQHYQVCLLFGGSSGTRCHYAAQTKEGWSKDVCSTRLFTQRYQRLRSLSFRHCLCRCAQGLRCFGTQNTHYKLWLSVL